MTQFARVEQGRAIIPVLIRDNQLWDLRPQIADITSETIASGALSSVSQAGLRAVTGGVSYLALISDVTQVPATGFNYKKHIEEMKVPTPTEPEVFLKSAFSVTGPFDPIRRGPNAGVKLDWETELGVVIGRTAEDVSVDRAADYIFGYVCVNDVSDRATQIDAYHQQHLVRAKSRPTYCPIGPYLTTGIDPTTLDVWTKVNDRYEQQGNTSDMLFSVYELLAYFSHYLRMVPGDIIATGTPPGVGLGKNRFLEVGDTLECGISNLGAQRHRIEA